LGCGGGKEGGRVVVVVVGMPFSSRDLDVLMGRIVDG